MRKTQIKFEILRINQRNYHQIKLIRIFKLIMHAYDRLHTYILSAKVNQHSKDSFEINLINFCVLLILVFTSKKSIPLTKLVYQKERNNAFLKKTI